MDKGHFTPIRGEQLEKDRMEATDGRLDRELRSKTIIPARYADEVWSNPDNILGMPYLVADLRGFKKVLKALKRAAPTYSEAAGLHRKLTLQTPGEEFSSPLCPVARHRKKREMHRGIDQFLFNAVNSQFRFETIIHGFSPTLDGTLEVVAAARSDFRSIREEMRRAGTGYLEIGTYEPDIRHADDLLGGKAALSRLAEELGWDVPDTGGYVVTSHRLVRVARAGFYREILDRYFPGYRRIRSDRLNRCRSLVENVDAIFDYIWKLEPHVNSIRSLPSRDCPRIMQSVFAGPTVSGKHRKGYSQDHLLVQWAVFYDRVGFEAFDINYVNKFAYDWFVESETDVFLDAGLYEQIHGYSKLEPNRRQYHRSSDHYVGQRTAPRTAESRRRRPFRLKASLDDPPDVQAPEITSVVAGQPVLSICR